MRQRLTDSPERFKQAASNAARREIPEDYKYNPKKLKHLKRILHNISIALGTLSSALNEFSRLKGPEISPDGLLGGIGYIIPVKDIKQSLITNVHGLSNIADCIADELTNPRWNAHEDKEVKELIKEKDEVVEKVDEEISPDDLVTVEEDEEPEEQIKQASIKEDVLAAAVKESLISFIGN
jgi:hypothetical protein